MTFTEALFAIFNDGDHVTRAHWNNRTIYLSVVEYQVCIHNYSSAGVNDGLPHPYIITENDYYADDWEIVADA